MLLNMNQSDRTSLLLRKNGFTFDADGRLHYPKGGDYYFQQNLVLSLYINYQLDRDGQHYKLVQDSAATPIPKLALAA